MQVRALVSALALALSISASPAKAQQYFPLTVENQSSSTVFYFYSTNAKYSGWGVDRLGDGTIRVGYETTFNMWDGSGDCVFDLWAKLRDGRVAQSKQNICVYNRWIIYDR